MSQKLSHFRLYYHDTTLVKLFLDVIRTLLFYGDATATK